MSTLTLYRCCVHCTRDASGSCRDMPASDEHTEPCHEPGCLVGVRPSATVVTT